MKYKLFIVSATHIKFRLHLPSVIENYLTKRIHKLRQLSSIRTKATMHCIVVAKRAHT